MGAYVVVVVVVVTTLQDTRVSEFTPQPPEHTHVVVLTEGARKRDGRGWVFIVDEDEDVSPQLQAMAVDVNG